MSASAPSTILDRLPAEIREEFEELGRRGRGPLGRLQTQEIVDDNINLIRRLLKFGSYADLASVLKAVGIRTKHGTPLSTATLSSAISRTQNKEKPRAALRRAAIPAGLPHPDVRARPRIEKVRSDSGGSSILRPSSAAPGADTGATFAKRAKAISLASPDAGTTREDDPRAAIFALLGDLSEEE
ncbi:hypothetical protein [Bradyrhizobium sp. 187]|uniref:hypothetical protein n=1 Tax=Bradyrhizobium sp. 187 TaxID=2782655 RepID=UPI001FFE728A|nr:hypothetical protein [Bradyrhizobium sp. 187]UPJ72014.1 hypothetical protein IVB19_31330 [Bradyrhizobium sp. 187]